MWRYESRTNVFCDKACENEFRRKNKLTNCVCMICNKNIYRKPSDLKKIKNVCCSIECSAKMRSKMFTGEQNHQYGLKGDLNPSWKSDERISSYGYRLIRCLEHPLRNCDDFVFEHRLVAERFLLNEDNSVEINGKMYLSPDYIVHHKDFDKLNNSLNNLEVMRLGNHARMHNTKLRNNSE